MVALRRERLVKSFYLRKALLMSKASLMPGNYLIRLIQFAAFALAGNIFFAHGCLAQQHRYFYDSNGNNVGSSMPAGQNTFYYDGQGNNVGSAMKAGKNTYYYDAEGNNVGSSMPTGINNVE